MVRVGGRRGVTPRVELLADPDDLREAGCCPHRGRDQRGLRRVSHEQAGRGIGDDDLDLQRREAPVEADRYGPDLAARENDFEELGHVLAEDRHPLTRLDPGRLQRVGDAR